MKTWLIVCSADANEITYETTVQSETEPGFWEAYTIAEAHGCPWFTVEEIKEA